MTLPSALKNYSAILGFPESQTMARIFKVLFDTDEAMALASALPGKPDELVAKTGLPADRVEALLHDLIMKGAIGVKMTEPDYYRLFPAMIELRDSSVLNPSAPQELFELWETCLWSGAPRNDGGWGLPPLLVIPASGAKRNVSRDPE